MNNRKTEKRFNIIDFIIIVIVIGCIAGIVVRYNVVDRIVVNDERDTVEISFLVTGVTPDIANAMNKGDTFYCESTGNSIGTLQSDPEVSDAGIVYSNDKGEPVEGTDSAKKDVRGVFKAKGVMTEDGFMLDGTQFVAAGKTLTVQSLDAQVSVIITEIKQVKG